MNYGKKADTAGIVVAVFKNCIRAIFKHEFSAKTHLLFALTNDAPSLALLILQLLGPADFATKFQATTESPLQKKLPQEIHCFKMLR
ncbi:MAG: hypothetical protein IIT73_03140 [Treponema sp.]|nr:hypothetical protein [Treponema sp.]